MDAIYTPPDLANFLVKSASVQSPAAIADFAAGDGALLRAAAARWPNAHLFGSDIDGDAVAALRDGFVNCEVRRHDFLGEECDGLPTDRFFDLILLNPPFSCRGNRRHVANVAGTPHSGSKALAFVARALPFLRPGGEIIAIVPASVLMSERDADLMQAIQAQCIVQQVGDTWKAAFRSHAVAVTVLRIVHGARAVDSINEPRMQVPLRAFAVEMARGSLSLHHFVPASEGPRFVHTTDMREGCLLDDQFRASKAGRRISGPAVLVQRVGRPSRDKVVLLTGSEVVLSDCVIALRTVPLGHEQDLKRAIVDNWDSFRDAYGGSCAPYTTLKRLRAALLQLGILSTVSGGEPQQEAETKEASALGERESRIAS